MCVFIWTCISMPNMYLIDLQYYIKFYILSYYMYIYSFFLISSPILYISDLVSACPHIYYICGALRDLIPLYKWYQIAQRTTYLLSYPYMLFSCPHILISPYVIQLSPYPHIPMCYLVVFLSLYPYILYVYILIRMTLYPPRILICWVYYFQWDNKYIISWQV